MTCNVDRILQLQRVQLHPHKVTGILVDIKDIHKDVEGAQMLWPSAALALSCSGPQLLWLFL